MKTAELTGALLDYWVAKAEGLVPDDFSLQVMDGMFSKCSSEWEDGGPIIDRERIQFDDLDSIAYRATISREDAMYWADGQTHLIAAMRCYVASKYGDEVPDQ
jgi:hypothetical protein